ncbi:MAG TPA: M48 family metallopeptidase [Gemmatimonadales bacterium]|nr:M48 family metallopeptidase [Gemmatimonadales bacterium]
MPECFTRAEAAQAPADTSAVVAVPEPTPLALRYHAGNGWIWAADTALGLAFPAAILFTGFSARLRRLASRLGRGRWLPTVAIYGALFMVVMSVLYLPLAWYAGFVRQHAYGLSTQSAGQWMGDWAKGVAVGAVVAALVLWIPYRLLRASPRRWWLWSGLAALPLGVLALLVGPVWIAPLFDDFGPMHDRPLEARILALAERAGIEGGRVYEVDKSEDTRMVNAYVTGIGATKRIVLWDTLLQRMTPDEVLFVMGHEMGHFVLHHTIAIILGAALAATLSLYAVHRVAARLIARHRTRFGFGRLDDVASVPLLVLVGGLVSFVITPGLLAWSRWQEREADRFGLEITGDPHAAAMAFVRMQQENLGVPRPGLLYTLWRGSHPSLASRIETANEWRRTEADR